MPSSEGRIGFSVTVFGFARHRPVGYDDQQDALFGNARNSMYEAPPVSCRLLAPRRPRNADRREAARPALMRRCGWSGMKIDLSWLTDAIDCLPSPQGIDEGNA